MIKKSECRVCACNKMTNFIEYKMPLFMGAVEEKEPFLFGDMNFQKCNFCGNVQIGSDVSSDILYRLNHNLEVIGSLWKEHYIEFYSFIEKDIKNKRVLEISDPSAKIATKGNDYISWTIIEPNPNFDPSEKIKLIRSYFDKNFQISEEYDVLVHSHFMEHAFDPNGFLKKCFDSLPKNGIMAFSVPNMDHLLKTKCVPNNILHFEHTYFYDRKVLNYLLSKNGFEILETKDHKSHSWFYKCKKSTDLILTEFKNEEDVSEMFLGLHNHHKNKLKDINKALEEVDISHRFLFGGHVNSQYYIQNGLSRVYMILDNSKSKQEKLLYGTEYRIQGPSTLVGINTPIVVCSHTGPYFEEITTQLRQINPTVKVL